MRRHLLHTRLQCTSLIVLILYWIVLLDLELTFEKTFLFVAYEGCGADLVALRTFWEMILWASGLGRLNCCLLVKSEHFTGIFLRGILFS